MPGHFDDPDPPDDLQTFLSEFSSGGGEVPEIVAIEAAHAVANSFGSDPIGAKTVLEFIVKLHPTVLARPVRGEHLAQHILDAVLRATDPDHFTATIAVLIKAYQTVRKLNTVFAHLVSTLVGVLDDNVAAQNWDWVNATLTALFEIGNDLDHASIIEICRLATNAEIAPELVVRGLQMSLLWFHVAVEWACWVDVYPFDDASCATAILKIARWAMSGLVHQQFPWVPRPVGDIDFSSRPLSKLASSYLFALRRTSGPLRLPSEDYQELSPPSELRALFMEFTPLTGVGPQPVHPKAWLVGTGNAPADTSEHSVDLHIPDIAASFGAMDDTNKESALQYVCRALEWKLKASQTTPRLNIHPEPSRFELDEEWSEFFDALLQSEALLTSSLLRVLACQALRLAFTIWQPQIQLKHDSTIGSWIIGCMKSSIRPVRAEAARLAECFMASAQSDAAFPVLQRTAASLLNAGSIESSYMLLSETAVAAVSEELNVILLKLIDYLGSAAPFHRALAFYELWRISDVTDQTTWQLLAPFWSSISIVAVRQVKQKPQLLLNLCKVLELQQEEFLARTEEFTVPFLVLSRQFDVIDIIAEARVTSGRRLIFDVAPKVLSTLLMQGDTDPIAFAEKRWEELSSRMLGFDFAAFLGSHGSEIFFELLKLAPGKDRNDSREARVVRLLALLPLKDDLRARDTGELMDVFVGRLVTLFGNEIRNMRGKRPYTIKIQCLRGLELLLRSSKADFSRVTSQILTLLQYSMNLSMLHESALYVWLSLVEALGAKASRILDITFAVFADKWDSLNAPSQAVATQLIETLMAGPAAKEYYATFGAVSLPGELARLLPTKTPANPYAYFTNLIRRLGQENVYVARRAVEDLNAFISEHQELLNQTLADRGGVKDVGTALRYLLNMLMRFRDGPHTDIAANCVKALGLFGAVDPHDIEIEPGASKPVVCNLEDAEESTQFAASFVENHLLKELEASVNPSEQLNLAYGIQEFLKFCGFTAQSTADDLARLFSKDSLNTLLPFLTTKFVHNTPAIADETYPIYNESISFYPWVTRFAKDMLLRTSGTNAEQIFRLARAALKSSDRHLSDLLFLLPYATLNAIVSSSENLEVFVLETTAVLEASTTSNKDMSAFHRCIFTILDYFALWARVMRQRRDMTGVIFIENVVSGISLTLMARCAFEIGSYPRAIRYWEQSMRDSPDMRTDEILEKFRLMYASLSDTDSFEGISTKFNTMTVEQEVLEHETTEEWDSALACYDVLFSQLGKWDVAKYPGMLESLNQANRTEDVLARLDDLESTTAGSNAITPSIAGIGVEVAWKRNEWEKMEKWISRIPRDSDVLPGYLGTVLSGIRQSNLEQVTTGLLAARNASAELLTKREITSLDQVRKILLYDHALADVESIASLKFDALTSSQKWVSPNSRQLDSRLARIGPEYESRDFLLSVRQAAFELSGYPSATSEVSKSYYLLAKNARKRGHWIRALTTVLKATQLKNPNAVKEHSKLLWAQGKSRLAIKMLSQELDDRFLTKYATADGRQSLDYAKRALLYTDWLEASGQAHSEELIGRYKAIQRIRPKWDKATYRLAGHTLKIFDTQRSSTPDSRTHSYYDGSIVTSIVQLLASTLSHGTKYAAPALPKLITLWLDFGALVDNRTVFAELGASQAEALYARQKSYLKELNSVVARYIARIPAYVFYGGLPQILSRFGQVNADVYVVLKQLVVTVCRLYPEQSLWSLIELSNTVPNPKQASKSAGMRNERGFDALETLERSSETLAAQIRDSRSFIESLKRLCYYVKDKMESRLNLEKAGFNLKSLPCPLVVPTQKMMINVMPHPGADMKKHTAFPDIVVIFKIDPEAQVMHSLQRPKKITVTGSDGQAYHLLCKGRDDVRKDSRLIEFTNTINGLLRKNDLATSRQLCIESYRVTPIDQASGIIEWVDDARPMKGIIESNFSARNINFSLGKVKNQFDPGLERSVREQNFVKIVHKLPAVLYDWFTHSFPDPEAWLTARRNYSQTTAVMSMVGFILGLGDRHLENLLLLQNSGKLLHVDFDCLFDKGQTFAIPEVVPFRLTRNMVDAFGIQGYEGAFRSASEITMRLLRENDELLMTVLEPFVHDPVVATYGSKRVRSEPQQALQTIRDKIRGIKSRDSVPLSVAGQVEDLIQQAVSVENLSRMYIGWAPFL